MRDGAALSVTANDVGLMAFPTGFEYSLHWRTTFVPSRSATTSMPWSALPDIAVDLQPAFFSTAAQWSSNSRGVMEPGSGRLPP